MRIDNIIVTAEQYLKDGDYNKAIKFLRDNRPRFESFDIENLITKAYKIKADKILATVKQYLRMVNITKR